MNFLDTSRELVFANGQSLEILREQIFANGQIFFFNFLFFIFFFWQKRIKCVQMEKNISETIIFETEHVFSRLSKWNFGYLSNLL